MSTLEFISRRARSASVMIFTICLLLSSPVWAEKTGIADIMLNTTKDDLLVHFNVTNCFTEEMEKAIKNGINTTFTFFIKLYEVMDFQLDKKIADLKVSHDIKYDSLKKIYMVRLSEKNKKVIIVQDFDEAKKLMSKIVGLKVIELSNLQKGKRYQISMMAELEKIRLPFYLHYVFFFLSLWDFETGWYAVDFRY